ncbi:MAG: phosphopantothenoylcysteine decarboxylase [Acidobacteriota bacterium]
MKNRILITSGPTVEPIDPVRFLSNRSSGKTGFYIAEEAKKRNLGEIIFITGPTRYIPNDIKIVEIESALEMKEQVLKYYNRSDIVIMAAAVSDFSSAKIYPEKIKKTRENFTLKLVKNPDILLELGKNKKKQILVGFAAETENMFENAQNKFKTKNLDLLVLNEISDKNKAFDVDDNQVYFISGSGIKKNEKMNKSEIASILWDEIENLINNKKIT